MGLLTGNKEKNLSGKGLFTKKKTKTQMALDALSDTVKKKQRKAPVDDKNKQADAEKRLATRQNRFAQRRAADMGYTPQQDSRINENAYMEKQVADKEKKYGAKKGSAAYNKKNQEEYLANQKKKKKKDSASAFAGSLVKSLKSRK